MSSKKKITFIVVCLVIIILISTALMFSAFFSMSNIVKARAIDTYATSESVDSLSDSMNSFSFEMYNELDVNSEDNVFFSPYSIFVALAMTYEGARGDTAIQMNSVLGFDQNDEVSLCSFGRIYNLLNIDAEYTLNTANALWTKNDYPFLEDYLNFIDNYYMGKATDIDFTNPTTAAEIINRWIEENTGGKIKDMLSSSDINPATVLILSNAIYFKGLWLTQFDVEDTLDRDFELISTDTVEVPTMILTDSEESFNYAENDDFQILELPYKGDAVSMIIILPKENNIADVEHMINNENLNLWMESMYKTDVNIYLPKFTYETEYNLKETLISMGMDIPFSQNADFSGMNGFGGLFIGKVLHKAFIEVNEEGTEAAAATTVHMLETSMPEPKIVFNADHPFTYLILHKETDTILFMGKVTNPLE